MMRTMPLSRNLFSSREIWPCSLSFSSSMTTSCTGPSVMSGVLVMLFPLFACCCCFFCLIAHCCRAEIVCAGSQAIDDEDIYADHHQRQDRRRRQVEKPADGADSCQHDPHDKAE